MEIENEVEGLGSEVEEVRNCYLLGREFLFEMMETFLEMDNGSGCTAASMHLTLLNCTPYKWFRGRIYVMCILSHTQTPQIPRPYPQSFRL